jgi:hypothetical protein
LAKAAVTYGIPMAAIEAPATLPGGAANMPIAAVSSARLTCVYVPRVSLTSLWRASVCAIFTLTPALLIKVTNR